jgi:predicted DNA-binding transcriptional regulator YafY
MSKRGYISRYLLIIKKLRAKPYSSFEELQSYIVSGTENLQLLDDNLLMGFSKRTLQRDIKEIRNLFGFTIEFSKAQKGYYIVQDESERLNFQRMMEAFDVYNSLNLAHEAQSYVHLEKRKPRGTENLYGLIHAIKNTLQIRFDYQKFDIDEISERVADPYSLKEYKERWYLLARDHKDGNVKHFGLDRLSNLEITNQTFLSPGVNIINQHYKYSLGIISLGEGSPEEIILSFEPLHGKYIKSLPLHESQEILKDNEKELTIRLKLWITYDLITELLSYGDKVRVIEPLSLVKEIKEQYQRALLQYTP